MRRRRLLHWSLSKLCLDCGSFLWPFQRRCGQRHTVCKHTADTRLWMRNEYPVKPWDCSFCRRPITTEARP